MKRFGRIRTKLAALLESTMREQEALPLLSIEPEDFWLRKTLGPRGKQ